MHGRQKKPEDRVGRGAGRKQTGIDRALTLVVALYSFAVFGYITATLASFFIERDEDARMKRE